MNTLCYKTLEEQNYQGYLLKDAPERILQFGEGNFMRAFVDYFVDVMNEKTDFKSKSYWYSPRAVTQARAASPISSMNKKDFIPYIFVVLRKARK